MPQSRQTTGIILSLVLLTVGCDSGNDGGQNTPPPAPPASPAPPVTPVPPSPEPPGEPEPPPSPPSTASGLDARPSNKTCIAPARSTGSVTIGTQPAFPKLTFRDSASVSSQPVAMVQPPGDGSRWYVASKVGLVQMFENRPDVASFSVVLDIDARVESSCAECGLLGIAIHPDFPATPRVYLTYTTMQYTGGGPDTHLSEFTSRDGGLTLDPESERVILRINKPGVNHHGGQIAFGPDGHLYFATGDGNVAAFDSAQRRNTLLGKMLRIDITGTTGTALYRIPSDNPFASSTALCGVNGSSTGDCPEIFAWGLRNPWRWSFDRESGEIWLGDVGRTAREEVNRIVRGGNYGWRCLEGTLSTTGMVCETPVNPRPPIAEYERTFGRAVTGGYVYRGSAIPALVGRYVFGDFVSGRIFDIPNDTPPTMLMTGGLETGLSISAFAEDSEGELYVVNIRGDIHRITGAGEVGTGVPTQLSDSGCVSSSNPAQPASGLIPYAPNADFWSDGAAKERWIALPDGQSISVGADGDWEFPNGSVLVKNFLLDNRLIETRLFMRHPDGVWAGYSYEWNAQGNDATLVRGGKQVRIGEQTWIYPSESQCMQCHTQAAGGSLGLETRQLAFNINYPQTGRDAHQLVTLNAINALASPIEDPTSEKPYPDPKGTTATLSERARAYLHTNCSQCHRPGGPTTSNMDLRYATALADTNACGSAPTLGDLGIADARLIAPGASSRSVLPARMNLRGAAEAMPPVGLGAVVDTEGLALIREWIDSLASCN
jgi:uncharacterized repeat protein (TIGR03806 family)